jgi:hypothetical protein
MYILRALAFFFLAQAVRVERPTPILPDPRGHETLQPIDAPSPNPPLQLGFEQQCQEAAEDMVPDSLIALVVN